MCGPRVCFLQDVASRVLRGPPAVAEAGGGLPLAAGGPGHPHPLPGLRGMEIRADICQNHQPRPPVRDA